MACEQAQRELHGYLDGELDTLTATGFEKHLESCAHCQRKLAAEQALRKSLLQAGLYERAPGSLRERLQGGSPVRMAAPAAAPARTLSWSWLAVAAVLVLAALVGWRQLQTPRGLPPSSLAASALVDAHLRSLQPGHLTDVESTDQHTVKPWFDGRLDFAPPVRDFAADGFPLLGGRLDVVGGRTVAALIYGRRKHIINVFVEPLAPAEAWNGAGTLQGYQWVAWQKAGFSFCAVSDVSAPDLDRLRELFLSQ